MQDMYSYVEGKLYNFKSMKVELNSYKIDLEYLNKDYEGCRGAIILWYNIIKDK